MPSSIHFERHVSPQELDRYLAMGFRVAGQAVYTSEYIKLEKERLISVLPLRLDITNYTFRKNLRKCKRKNDARFRTVIGPASTSMVAEYQLNRRYMELKPDKGIEDFSYHVIGRRLLTKLIPTWQVKVYDEDRLIATSYFDLGKDSAYSKQGVYDPEYKDYSLGIYTMLLEIEFCQWAGRHWYYPGYIGLETEEFDYKLRLGPMEYFDFRKQSWQLFERSEIKVPPLLQMRQQLEQLHQILAERGITSRVLRYFYGDVRYAMRMVPEQYLDGPYLLQLLPKDKQAQEMVVTYELVGDYPFGLVEIERCFAASMHPKYVNKKDTYDYVSRAKRNLHYSQSAEQMAVFILQLQNGLTQGVDDVE